MNVSFCCPPEIIHRKNPHMSTHFNYLPFAIQTKNLFYRDCWLYGKKMYGTLSNTISFVCHTLLLSVTQFSISHMILLSVTQFYHLSHNYTICHIILLYVTWFYYLSHNSNFSAFKTKQKTQKGIAGCMGRICTDHHQTQSHYQGVYVCKVCLRVVVLVVCWS